MSNTNITIDNNNDRVTLDISRHELSLIKTYIALTIASIAETKRKGYDSSSRSLDSNTLELLYNKLESLFAKLEKKKRKGEREEEKQNSNDDKQHKKYKFSTKIDKIRVGKRHRRRRMNIKMEDNDNDVEEWRIVEIDESNYKAVCDLIERQHLDMTPEEVINSILELEVKTNSFTHFLHICIRRIYFLGG